MFTDRKLRPEAKREEALRQGVPIEAVDRDFPLEDCEPPEIDEAQAHALNIMARRPFRYAPMGGVCGLDFPQAESVARALGVLWDRLLLNDMAVCEAEYLTMTAEAKG